jgi:hypothetical protein
VNTLTGIACIVVAVLIVLRARFLVRMIGWRRLRHELVNALRGGF